MEDTCIQVGFVIFLVSPGQVMQMLKYIMMVNICMLFWSRLCAEVCVYFFLGSERQAVSPGPGERHRQTRQPAGRHG